MLTSNKLLRVNLQLLYRWSRFSRERCDRCKQPAGYGAEVEFYMPIVKSKKFKTEGEKHRAADDYCNALADQQERGNFTMHALYLSCGACVSREIMEDFGYLAAPVLSDARLQQREHLWMAVFLLYEPGPYGKCQPFTIYSQIPTSLEEMYARARQGRLSDKPRFETYLYPIDGV